MNSIFKILKPNRHCFPYNNFVFISTNPCLKQVPQSMLRKQTPAIRRVEPYGWFMLIIPVASFGLGVWQVQRKKWKENLIAELQQAATSAPIELPQSLDELNKLEYHPVRVRGTFLHDKEIYMGPRGLIEKDALDLPSFLTNSQSGYLVVTPFKLADRDETILVNRGWVTKNRIRPKYRRDGQVEGVVDVIGLVRLNENRPNFSMKSQVDSNLYFYRDLESMCKATGASPVFLDQTLDFNADGGPIGGQTRVTLRNEHMSYIITWFSLSAATFYMWFRKFVLKK